MFCSKCGKDVQGDVAFCSSCGAPLNNGANPNPTPVYTSTPSIDAHTTSIVAYITWIGFIIAICAGDKEGAKFHLNQALVLNLFALITPIPFVGWAFGVFVFVCWIIALISACQGEERAVPLFGQIKILN